MLISASVILLASRVNRRPLMLANRERYALRSLQAKPSKGPRSRPPLRPVGSGEPISAPAPYGARCCALQSPAPGFGEKYWCLSGFPSHSFESGGSAFLTVIFGQIFAYSAFSDSHFSRPGSVSGLIASTGHSGSHTPQSMHSSGWDVRPRRSSPRGTQRRSPWWTYKPRRTRVGAFIAAKRIRSQPNEN